MQIQEPSSHIEKMRGKLLDKWSKQEVTQEKLNEMKEKIYTALSRSVGRVDVKTDTMAVFKNGQVVVGPSKKVEEIAKRLSLA